MVIASIDGIWCFAELRPPARFQVPSPDPKIEPAFQDGIARGSGDSSQAECAKGTVSLCSRMSFGSSACRLVVVNVEAALFSLIDFPFLNRTTLCPVGTRVGMQGASRVKAGLQVPEIVGQARDAFRFVEFGMIVDDISCLHLA